LIFSSSTLEVEEEVVFRDFEPREHFHFQGGRVG
jgi:hypothetical protein